MNQSRDLAALIPPPLEAGVLGLVSHRVNRLLDGGYNSEKIILAMSMDDILALQNVTVADIALVNELQKAIRSNRVIVFLAHGEIKEV